MIQLDLRCEDCGEDNYFKVTGDKMGSCGYTESGEFWIDGSGHVDDFESHDIDYYDHEEDETDLNTDYCCGNCGSTAVVDHGSSLNRVRTRADVLSRSSQTNESMTLKEFGEALNSIRGE